MNFYNRSSLGTEASACLYSNVGLVDSGLVRSRVVTAPPSKGIKSRITP